MILILPLPTLRYSIVIVMVSMDDCDDSDPTMPNDDAYGSLTVDGDSNVMSIRSRLQRV